jgi:hypothetical protein
MVPLTLALGDAFPSDLVQLVSESPVGEVLGKIGLVRLEVTAPADVSATLMFRDELALELPGVAGLALVFGGDGAGHTRIDFRLSLGDPFFFGIDAFPIRLRLPRDALRPVTEAEDGSFTPDLEHAVEIGITPSIGFFGDGTVSLSGLTDITISSKFMIGDSGIVLDIPRLALHLTEGEPPPPGLPDGWRGVFIQRAAIHLPRAIEVEALPDALEFTNCGIGSGGFTGEVAADWSDDPLSASLLGFTARLQRLEFAFQQNAFVRVEVAGEIELSFFDTTVGVALSIGADGEFSATLSAVEDEDDESGASETPDGLISFTLPQLLTLTVESMRFDNVDDVFRFTLSGELQPLLAGLDWPKLDVESLSIDEHGNVDFDGGWLELPEQQTLDFHAFQISLSEIGFGSEDDTSVPVAEGEAFPSRQWIGVSGSIRLVEGLPLSASVDGMKVSWRPDIPGGDVKVSIEGIGVSLEIPGTLSLEGEVRYETIDDENLSGDIFRGSIDLNLMALRVRVGGELIIGHLTERDTGESFDVAFVVLSADFPAGIPLGATGAGLYGLKGMVGVNIAPDRAPSAEDPGEPESWYEWYKAPPERDVTAMEKWAPLRDNYAFGAGLTIGTIYDDGYTINARVLLAVLLPGPVIILEGRANILKSRGEDSAESGAFYLLCVLDCRAGTFQLNIDVQYEIDDVIQVGGGIEVFFDFNDSSRWHLWIGQKEPESKRIGASILSLFTVNVYFMVDANGIATGAKAALEIHESYGPLSIDIAVGLRFDAAIFFNPPQVEGAIELFGQLGIRIFGFGLGLALRLLLEAKAAKPFWVHGLAHVAVTLPFPLPSFEATVEFTWEEPIPPPPVWPLLHGIELTHHLRPESHWTPSENEAEAPIVPVDAVAVAKFARPLAGRSYRMNGTEFEFLGSDPIADWTLTYSCVDMILSKWVPEPPHWEHVAEGPLRSSDISDTIVPLDFSDESFLNGTDAEEPAWRLWTHERLPGTSVFEREDRPARDLACPPPAEVDPICIDFREIASGTPFPARFRMRDWELDCGSVPQTRGGRLETSQLWVRFPRAMGKVTVRYSQRVDIRAFRAGVEVSVPPTGDPGGDSIQIWEANVPEGIDTLSILSSRSTAIQPFTLQSICASPREALAASGVMAANQATAAGAEATAGRLMLEPRTRYKIECHTAVDTAYRTDAPSRVADTKAFYFETSDGPGANPLDVAERDKLVACNAAGAAPAPHATFLGGSGNPHDVASPYVQRTVPSPDDDPFYYDLDPAVVFGESYFPDLYHASWSLVLRARDRNHAILGESIARHGVTRLPRTAPGAVTWEAARARGGCGPAAGGDPPRGDTLVSADASTLRFQPNRRYSIELLLRGCFERVIHTFPLTTSRYADPAAHLTSGQAEDGAQFVRSSPSSTPISAIPASAIAQVRNAHLVLEVARTSLQSALTTGNLVGIHDAKAAADAARGECDRICNESFSQILTALGLTSYQPRPPRTEVVALALPAGTLLLVESAEPIDWHRWSLTGTEVDSPAAAPRQLFPCPNGDRTRSLLLPREGPLVWGGANVELDFGYRITEAPDLPTFTSRGAPYTPANVRLFCSLD